MNTSVKQAQEGKSSLLRHFGVMLALCLVLQAIIVVRDSRIDLMSQLLLGIVALYYAWYHYTSQNLLRRLRFGRLVAHMVGFLIINLSYHVHAFILFVSGNAAIQGTDDFSIDPSWFGILFGMTSFWGLGLLIHLIASIANRGFEELPRG